MILRLILMSGMAGAMAIASPAAAQTLDVPFVIPQGDGQAGDCATSTVTGLDPNGDGFLSVRSGPGSRYRKLDQVYNGDVVATCRREGRWHGVLYRARGTGQGPANRQGWVHGNWLRDLAG